MRQAVFDSEIDGPGPAQVAMSRMVPAIDNQARDGDRARARGSNSNADVSYRSRPFSDLVDEDKHGFVRRRIVATIFGGYRTVADEVEATGVGIGLHLAQLGIYLIIPAWILVSTIIFKETDSRTLGMIVGGAVPLVLNLVLMASAYHLVNSQQAQKEPELAVDEDVVSCCSKSGYLFLFPARSGKAEIALCALLTFAYGALMVYVLHPTTLAYFFDDDRDLVSLIPLLILIGLSGFSLFSGRCPESAVYLNNDNELNWGSNHYQRATYYILIAIYLVACEAAEVEMTQTGSETAYTSFFIVYALQVLGILSHPIVTILWAMEQVNLHVLGTTARASDIRIVLSFIINGAFVGVSLYLGSSKGLAAMLLSMVLLSFLASQNLLVNIGLKKPFRAANERLKTQRCYANIVFAAKESAPQSEPIPCERSTIRYMAQSLFLALVVAAMAVFEAQKTPASEPKDATIFVIAAFALTAIQWAISALHRFAVCRVIPCSHLQAGRAVSAITAVMRMLITLCLTFAFLKMSAKEAYGLINDALIDQATSSTKVSRIIKGVLIYRAFNGLYHHPLASSLEALVLLQYPTPLALAIAAFAVSRLHIFFNKLTYVAASVVTAVKNKKQRFSNQDLCFFLQFTIFLPLTLGVILITTLLDTATIPYLGFAFFIIGYPKPLRGWSAINPVSANPSDSRSDGHLYQAMMPQLSAQIQNVISADPFNFGRGSFYFMKNEKMIVLIQVLERGHNYVVFAVKGTELQETTVCHAEENDNINQISEQLFEKNETPANFAFSLSVLKQINFGVYDDQKVSLSGIIDNPEFEALVKKAYMRIVMMQLKQLFQTRSAQRLFKVYQGEMNERERAKALDFYDRNWPDHLQFDHYAIEFTKDRIPTMQSSITNFKNQISPAQGNRIEPSQMTFLDRLEAQQPNRHLQSTGNAQQMQLPPLRGAPRRADLEQLEENKQEPPKVSRSGGVAARPIAQSAVPGPNQANAHTIPQRKPKARPRDDLDELEDMLDNLEGGARDELDDLLDDLEEILPSSTQTQKSKPKAAVLQRQSDHASSNTMSRPNPSATSAEAGGGEPVEDWHPRQREKLSSSRSRTQKPSRPSVEGSLRQEVQSYDQRQERMSYDTNQNKRDGRPSDIEKFVFQSFQLLFGDEFQNMPLKLMSVFKGDLKKTFDTRSFLDAEDEDIQHLKYCILQSARLAFHFSLESFIMGEMDLPEPGSFENEIKEYNQEWFFGSEEYLWNSAIERNLPNLERLIQKKDGQYHAHRLKFGQSKESTFNVFQFRREVIRGIWANLNLELLYYTNANDERFSIQAEKDILRNLLVQLAEIPLGYPVFSSGAESTLF